MSDWGQVVTAMYTKPNYYAVAEHLYYPKYTCTLFEWADTIQYELQLYLVGDSRTMHQASNKVNEFLQAYPGNPHAQYLLSFVLRQLKRELVIREWYELMQRFDNAAGLLNANYGVEFSLDDEPRAIPVLAYNYWSNPL